jgi:hypothetical protein
MSTALEDDISLENLISYADACNEVSTLFESMFDNEYDFLVVPSRGAAPIVDACTVCWTSRRERLDDRGGLERVVKSFLSSPLTNAIFLPFTADAGNLCTGVAPRDIRRFWCRVVAGMLRDPQNDPFFRYYQYLTSKICSGPALERRANKYQINGIARGNRFIFIDTAVSGQAACEIMDGFAEIGLEGIFYIIVVDENGAKLKSEYQRKLQAAELAGTASLVYMKRLFTEDRGPAISGIWSVVFPELMDAAMRLIPEFRDLNCAGAGFYYWTLAETVAPDDPLIVRAVGLRRQMLITALIMPKHSGLEEMLSSYRSCVQEHDLFSKRTTLEIARPRLRRLMRIAEHSLDASS